jgi:ferredoxin
LSTVYNDDLTRKVFRKAKSLGASQVGIASAEVLNEGLEVDFRPEDVLPGCRSVVVVSLHIPDGALEIMRRGVSNYSYNLFGYAYLNRELDFLAYQLSNFIEEFGYATLPIPGRNCSIGARKPSYGMLSFRHAAVAAGLASFGLSGLALTPKFGSRQRFLGLPTTAPLRPAEKILAPAEVCDGCLECVAHCPAKALEINPPHVCQMGGQTFKFARAIPSKCRTMASGLSSKVWPGAKFNPKVDVPVIAEPTPEEVYHQLWSERDPRLRILEHSEATFGATNCGRCMAFCTAGHEAMKRRLSPEDRQTGYADDNVLARDGQLKPLIPKPKPLGRELLGLA